MDCFGTYFTHAQSCDNVHVQSATGRTASVHTHAQSCDNVHVQSATDWAASVHTLHMPKAVIKFVFEVYGMDCWRTYLTHAQICDNIRVQSATEWIVFSPFSRFRVFAFSFFPVSVLGVFAFSRFRVFVFRRRHPRGRDTDFVCTVGSTIFLGCNEMYFFYIQFGINPSQSKVAQNSKRRNHVTMQSVGACAREEQLRSMQACCHLPQKPLCPSRGC